MLLYFHRLSSNTIEPRSESKSARGWGTPLGKARWSSRRIPSVLGFQTPCRASWFFSRSASWTARSRWTPNCCRCGCVQVLHVARSTRMWSAWPCERWSVNHLEAQAFQNGFVQYVEHAKRSATHSIVVNQVQSPDVVEMRRLGWNSGGGPLRLRLGFFVGNC